MPTDAAAPSPVLLRILGHDLRWAIVRLLALGDMRVWELVSLTGQAASLVSYHLSQLRAAGLVDVRRSEADGRDSYYALDLDAVAGAVRTVAVGIHPGLFDFHADDDVASSPPARRARVLFICTGNSSRSQMAEGWLRHLGGSRVAACSAGTTPTSLHPLAVAAMEEFGVDISSQRVKGTGEFTGQRFDRVVTLCDRAREACPEMPAATHWSVPNPAGAHPADLDAFRSTAKALRTRVRYLLPLLSTPGDAAQQVLPPRPTTRR